MIQGDIKINVVRCFESLYNIFSLISNFVIVLFFLSPLAMYPKEYSHLNKSRFISINSVKLFKLLIQLNKSKKIPYIENESLFWS